MRIEDFPRPPEDNGRGIHWSASTYHPDGGTLERWIQELVEMKIKWVKVLDDGGGSSIKVCNRLIEEGIMPVVRLYRPEPNPGHIAGREINTIRDLISLGVRYFETNNEPNIPAEWRNGYMPPNWLEVVVDNFIFDADTILSLGGLPAFPSMIVTDKENPFEIILRKGRRDILESGAWLAIHNYTLNHPLDYPYDDVNQSGKPLEPDEYDALGSWAWDNQPMDLINRWREKDKNPGHTSRDEPYCFLQFEGVNSIMDETLGFRIPILGTEGGPVVGWRDDRRYPRVTPDIHRKMVEEIAEYLQGTRVIHGEGAPDNFFCLCHWLIANYEIGYFGPGWESQAWYSHWWDSQFGLNGRLPAVDALKALPTRSRLNVEEVLGSIEGFVKDKNGDPLQVQLTLVQGDRVIAKTTSDEKGDFKFERIPAGQYKIKVEWRKEVEAEVRAKNVTRLGITGLAPAADANITGSITYDDGNPVPGETVRLVSEDGETLITTQTDTNGNFKFAIKAQGEYTVQAEDRQEAISITGDGNYSVHIEFPAPQGFVYRVVTKRLLPAAENKNHSLFFGQVLDQNGQPLNDIKLEMRWEGAGPDTRFPVVKSGHFVSKPPGYYEFLHTAGVFSVRVVQGDWESEVADNLDTINAPGQEHKPVSYEINFQLLPKIAPAHASKISGKIPGGKEGQKVILHRGNAVRTTTLTRSGYFEFSDLAAGNYQIELEGIGIIENSIELTGRNQKTILFPLQSVIQGEVENGFPGQTILLRSETYSWTRNTTLSENGEYRFENLPKGKYTVSVGGKEVSGIETTGTDTVTVPKIVLEVPPPKKVVQHYFLLDPNDDFLKEKILLLRPYLQKLHGTAGFSVEEARHAFNVSIVGALEDDVVSSLEKDGCNVSRLPSTLRELEAFVLQKMEG